MKKTIAAVLLVFVAVSALAADSVFSFLDIFDDFDYEEIEVIDHDTNNGRIVVVEPGDVIIVEEKSHPVIPAQTPYYVEKIDFRGRLILNVNSGLFKMKGYKDGDTINVTIGNAGEFALPVLVQRAFMERGKMSLNLSVFDTNKAEIDAGGVNGPKSLGVKEGDPVYFWF